MQDYQFVQYFAEISNMHLMTYSTMLCELTRYECLYIYSYSYIDFEVDLTPKMSYQLVAVAKT